jgi:nucleotide-binding universal stress UspA family protein
MKTATVLKGTSARGKSAKRSMPATLQVRNVLVAIDFSAPSLEAIEAALPLIKHFGADLHLVHVFEPDYLASSMVAIPLVVPELEIGQRVRRRLRDVAKDYSVPLHRENIHAIKGRPFEEICRLAQEIDIDLIVLATRGNTGLKHLALGSTAERVVRYSACPVLVVRGSDSKKKSAQQLATFRKILVPVDFLDCSMKGLEYAKALTREFKAKLILLHSIALQYYVASDEYARYDFPLLMRQVERAAQQQMSDLVQQTNWNGIEVETALQNGHAGQQICEEASDRKADLIAISTHGRTGFKHVLLGSTAEYVVRHASCPVLVVPSRERALPKSAVASK